MDPIVQMRRRIVRHMIIGPLGSIAIFVSGFVLAAFAKRLLHPEGRATGATLGLIIVLAVGGVAGGVAFGWWSAFKFLRCPACEAVVAWLVSWKFSLFSSSVADQCPKCGVTLFAPTAGRRFLSLMLVAVGIGMVAAFLLGYLRAKH